MAARSIIQVDEALASMDRDGYAVIPGLASRDALEALEQRLDESYRGMVDRGELFRGGGTVSGHLNCYPGEAARPVYDSVCEGGLLELVERLGGPLDRLRVTMNYNLPGSRDQHYHADGLYMEQFVICNVAVVDTDLVNGAIDMLPGTHQQFYPFWKYALERKYRTTTRLPMQRGDVLVRLSTVWHRGMANRSGHPRPMLSFTFGEVSAPSDDPFATSTGEPMFYANWYGTDRKGELREQAFVRAPWAYSSMRFARSLVGKKGYASW